ncbi:glutathione S-transferase [Massarina eburnea CBS 473.64]|uniref:Glutathione S-transferase n=1 Tax=Massarina eburnea CBS 473.64 TaxID=1395130 RepID=A0A6A6SF23_9PLEO|nr:glutathione S-transferase [Massarina eburnea CBS 473.64]
MTPKLHLYISPGSCALAPHIILHESSLPFNTTSIATRTGFPTDHLHINPKGQVPVLLIDDETVTENLAILTAIAQLVPEKNLLGTTNLETVRVYEWMSWLSGKLHGQAFGSFFRPGRFVTAEDAYDDVKTKAVETIGECFRYIEKMLEGRIWAVGNAFTVVDAYLFVFYRWGAGAGFVMGDLFPNYTRLVHVLAKKDSVVKAVKAEGIEFFVD